MLAIGKWGLFMSEGTLTPRYLLAQGEEEGWRSVDADIVRSGSCVTGSLLIVK